MLPLSNVTKASDTVLNLLLEKMDKAETKEEVDKLGKQIESVKDFQNLYEELMFDKYPGLEEYETWVKTA